MANRCYLRAIGHVLLCVCCFILSGALSAPCTTSSTVQLTVNSSLEASQAAETVSCTGGTFSIQWLGNIFVLGVFNVSGGTVLSVYGGGGEDDDVMDGDLAAQLFTLSDGAELNLEGLTMTGAFKERDAIFDGGGVVHATDSVVTMTDCVVTGNLGYEGGAVFLEESHLELYGVTSFTSNVAENNGGAIYASDNSTILVVGETDWRYNVAENSDNGGGGAIYLTQSSTLSLLGKSTLSGNSATLGAAVYWRHDSFFNVTGEVEFNGNEADIGGAIAGRSDNPEPFSIMSLGGRVNFFNNTAGSSGGALSVLLEGDLTITGEVNFTRNHAGEEGGAIAVGSAGGLNFGGNAIVSFTNNTCEGSGGGIAMWGSDGLSFGDESNVEFVDNAAGNNGGAIFVTTMGSVQFSGSPGNASFVNNSATNSGGAVQILGAEDFYMSHVEFVSNTARIGGALVVESSADGESSSFEFGLSTNAAGVYGCTFFDNVAGEDGGALHVGSGFLRVGDCTFDNNTAGRAGGAVSISGVLDRLDHCTFHTNIAPSGPALVNAGTIDQSSSYLEFSSNSLSCPDNQFIDYPDLPGDEASNASEARYLIDCEDCAAWDLCTNCTVLGDSREPACAEVLDYTTSPLETGTLETLELDGGYWRATNISRTILSCYNGKACVGGGAASNYCAEGYKGPYCAVCEEGYAPGLSFSCSSCSNGSSRIAKVLAAILIVVMVVVLVAILVDLMALRATPERENRCAAGFRRLKSSIPFQSLKIAVVSWQIIKQASDAVRVTYPASYERFLAIVGLFNLDVAGFLASACLVATNFYDKLLFSTLGPIAVLAVLACTYAVAIQRDRGSDASGSSPPEGENRAAIRKKHASVALLVAFLVYGSVSGAVFGVFACEDLDDGGSYLRGDYSIRCDTEKHRAFQVYATLMIFLYPVGIPVLFAVLLLSNREALSDTFSGSSRDDNPSIKIFADLWEPYRPEMYLFELLEYLRRILLTGIVVFIFPNTAAQIAVTFMIEFFFFVVSVVLLPYKKRSDAWLSHVGHVVVLVTLYLALLLKVDVSDETDSSQEVFAGVLVFVHCLMVLSVLVEMTIFMFQHAQQDGASTSSVGGWFSSVRERRDPAPRRQSELFEDVYPQQDGTSGEEIGVIANGNVSAPVL